MSISRKLPATNISRQFAMTAAKTKKDSTPPGGNLLSSHTSTRLDADSLNYNTLINAVTVAETSQRSDSKNVDPQRVQLRTFIGGYFGTLNNGIHLGIIPRSSRALFGLDVNNDRIPDLGTDAQLVNWGQQIIDGDALRVTNGGVAMAFPSIIEFQGVFTPAKLAINAISNSKTALINAQKAVNDVNVATDKTIVRVWDEIETSLSDYETAAMRSSAREWGVKYVSQGLPAIISGICLDSVSGLPVCNVVLHLDGVGTKFFSDSFTGAYSINTNQNGDLVIIAIQADYLEQDTTITLTDGETLIKNIIMVHL
jgi:hypothetical protein